MNILVRVLMTLFVWSCVTAIIIVSLVAGSSFSAVDMDGVIFFLLIATVVSTGFFWNWGRLPLNSTTANIEQETEKAKRDRLDSVLRDLSDSQLRVLREKLSTGELDEDRIAYMLGDDGEIIPHQKR